MPTPAAPKPAPPAESGPASRRGSSPEGAQVDAVVVEGEARIAPRIALRVELADDRGDVRLQEADAHDDQGQRQVEDVREERVRCLAIGELVVALGQVRRQRRRGRQALDGEPAVGRGAVGVAAGRRPSA